MFGINLHLFLSIIFVNLFSSAHCEIPRTVLCADSTCSEPISEAQGKVLYYPSEEHVLSFKKGTKILITSKTKEKNGYWGAKIGDKIGFVPSEFVKETRVWKSMDMLQHEVPIGLEPAGVNTEKKPETQNADIQQGSTSPLSNIIHDEAGELVNETQNPESHKESAKPTSDSITSSSQVDAVNEIPNIASENENTKTETEEKIDKESGTNSAPHSNNAEKSESSSEILKSNINLGNEGGLTNSDSQSGETIGLDKNLGDKLSTETESNVNLNSNEENVKRNADSLLDKNENKYAEGINNFEVSSSEVFGDDEQEMDDSSEDIEGLDDIDVDNINETNGANPQVPLVEDNNPSSVPLKDNPIRAESKPSINVETFANNWQNILPNHNEGVKIQREPETGTVANDINENSLKLGMNVGQNESLAYDNTVNVSASVSSSTSSSSSVSNSLPVANDVHVKPADDNVKQPGLPSHEHQKVINAADGVNVMGSQFAYASQQGIPQNGVDPPRKPDPSMRISPGHLPYNYVRQRENFNAEMLPHVKVGEGNSAGVPPVRVGEANSAGVPPMRFGEGNSPGAPPVRVGEANSAGVPPVRVGEVNSAGVPPMTVGVGNTAGLPPMRFGEANTAGVPPVKVEEANTAGVPPVRFGEANTAGLPQMRVGEVNSAGIPPLTNINNHNSEASQQFLAPSSASLQVDDVKPVEILESSNEQTSNSNEEQISTIYNGMQETTQPTPSTATGQNDKLEEHTPGGHQTPQQVEDAIGGDFHYELPAPADVATAPPDMAETPSDFNFESSTPLPPPNLVTESYQNAEENTIPEVANTETGAGGGFFSNMGDIVLGWVGLGSKKEEPEPTVQEGNPIEETLFKEPEFYTKEDVIAPDETCKAADGSSVSCNEASTEEHNSLWSFWLLDNKVATSPSSYNTFIYLVVTAVTVLLFTLGYYFIEKFRSDGPLIAKVNKLEQELLVSSKECLILKDELVNTKEKLNLFETSSNDKIITALQQELDESKKIKAELENNIEVLQQELDAATEAGLDLNRMLSEVLTQKGGSETLMESVEHLQAQLNNQQKIIDEMTSKLFTKTNENQELQDELAAANEKIESLEGEIEDMRGNLNVHLKDNEDVIEDLTSKNNELHLKINQMNEAKEKEIAKLKKGVADLEKKLKATGDSLKIKEEECNNLKDSMKKIKVKDGKSIDSLFESARIKAELGQATSENASLKDRLKAEGEKFGKVESKVKKLEEEIQKLRQMSSDAEKEKTEAQTRLEVLSNYFKEKETQLQKELGLREAMWVQKQGDDSTIYEKMKSLEEEISSYKSQNEALKKEILDQERGLKAQITTLEKKAHENWIAARQAERKLEEMKQEASQLRNKMTLMEKNISNDLDSSQHHRVNDELNGGDALSPLIHDTSSPILFPPPLPLDPNNSSLMPPGFIPPPLFMPPPPGGFMPPPPPFLPGDHRPPPLGRMSSPPLNNRFSPPPPDYAYDRMSTPPMSPSNRNYRSPNESERERFRHRTPTSPSFRSRNWEEGPPSGMSGFRPITSERDSRREHKGGSNLSSGHSSDSLDKSSRHSSRV